MDCMHVLSYYLDSHVLASNRELSTKNKKIGHCYVTIEQSKCQAMHCTVMIDSSNYMHCTISSASKDSNETCVNPVEIISDKKH